jgi:hypothetical protein
VTFTSRVDTWIEELREYDRFLDAEKARIRLLLNAADGVESRTNTTEILQEMFQDSPDVEYTATEAEAELRKRGWVTESTDPVNAVRAALARLKNSGEIESVGRGTFRLVPEDPSPSKEYDDPWASMPPVRAAPAVDDEPPF